MIKDSNYLVVQGYMINQLSLKGNELIVYALIKGFCQDETSYFEGSSQYVADWISSTKKTALTILKSLTEKGLLEKKEVEVNGVKFCKYKVVETSYVEKNLHQGDVKITLGGGVKFTPNNNIINNNINKDSVVDMLFDNLKSENISETLQQKIGEFIRYRKEINKPIKTYRSIKTLINQIGNKFVNEQHLIDSIDDSIANQYQGVFPTKIFNNQIKKENTTVSPNRRRL